MSKHASILESRFRPCHPCGQGRLAGTSLIELLCALAIVLLVLLQSMPNFQSLRTTLALNGALNRISASISLAKTTAISSGQPVTLCGATSIASGCTSDWSSGILLFIDQDDDQQADASAAGQDGIVHWLSMEEFDGTITWRAFGGRDYIRFESLGFVSTSNGSFTVCSVRRSDPAARLVVNRAARHRIDWTPNPAAACPETAVVD